VVNLSAFPLAEQHRTVLGRGLGFAIQPNEFSRVETLKGFVKFKNRILSTTSYSEVGKGYVNKVRDDIQDIRVRRTHSNLSQEELKALREIRDDDRIVVKPADKGRAVVVWDRNNYCSEIHRQLSDPSTYREEPRDLTPEIEMSLARRLQSLEFTGDLHPDVVDKITPRGCRTPPMYGLPKIHKLATPIAFSPDLICKARPIIGAVGCATEQISAFVDEHIQPLARAVPSYLQDTTHFLRNLAQVTSVPAGSLLVTADVTSLYPSIPHADGLNALRVTLDTRSVQQPPTDTLIELATMVLENNHFTFGDKFYTQMKGTAMGTRFAPSYAIIFMGEFEKELLRRSEKKPLCWWRYIDDVFLIWQHGSESLQDFIDICNSINSSIQLNFESSADCVNFLDVSVHLDGEKLETSLYRKPTDTLQYLHYESCHPAAHKLPIAYSQALRISKISSRRHDALSHCKELKAALIRRGYPRGPVQRQIERALSVDRKALIFPEPSDLTADPNPRVVPMVIPYHPDIAKIPHILKAHLHLLNGFNIQPKVFWKPPKKLRNVLVSSFLRMRVDRPMPRTNDGVGMAPCHRPRCKTCKHVDMSTTTTSTTTGLVYRMPSATCTTKDVIYLLKFTNCGKMYVGQTSQTFSNRMTGHRSSVTKEDRQLPFSHHFLEHEHEWADVKVTVLERVAEKDKLDDAESFWISQLMSDYPHGLNIQNVLYRNCFKMSDVL
jgi:hypothetical protein